MEEAIASFRAAGEISAAARTMGTLVRVVRRLGDPRQWTLEVEALALLEPLGPSPELVAALADVARVDAVQGRSEDAVVVADRALDLAEEFGFPRPARALGVRGMARADLGDPGGLGDYREAIDLATEAGQGREVGLLHNNLGWALWPFEGPEASLEVLRAGIAYVKARGLTEILDALTESLLEVLLDTTNHDEALALAAEMAPRVEASGDVFDLNAVRAVQARILSLRGRGAEVVEWLDWLEASSREFGTAEDLVLGLASATMGRAGVGQDEAAAGLLAEVESYPGSREQPELPHLAPGDGAYRSSGRPSRTRGAAGERSRAPHPLRRARPRRGQRRPHRGPRGPAGGRRCLRRRRRSLGAVRGRPRAGVRAPRPGPVPGRALPTDRGRTRPAARPRDLRAAPGGSRACRDRRARWAGDTTQFVVLGLPSLPCPGFAAVSSPSPWPSNSYPGKARFVGWTRPDSRPGSGRSYNPSGV